MSNEHISRKSAQIPPFIVMDILEKAKELRQQGIDVVNMGVGEPDFDTPEPIKRAGIAAIEEGKTKYTHSLGLEELRTAVVTHMSNTYSVGIDSAQVLVASGTSNALFLSLAALLDEGDEVIMTNPGYACYPNFVSFLGGTPVFVPVTQSEGWQLDPQKIADKTTAKTRAILINSPANPTGALLENDRLKALCQLGPTVISDEIYHGLVYEGNCSSAQEFGDNVIVIDGFSKRYAMTGWRLGYAIVPHKYLRPMQKMQQNFNISPNSFVQWAGVAALREGAPYVAAMRKEFDIRRRFLLTRLDEIGLEVGYEPKGAFYVMVNIQKYDKSSFALANRILEEAHVAVTPGIDFGSGGEGYIRLSYATSLDRLEEGIVRLQKFFQ